MVSMKDIKVGKLVLNIGAGKNTDRLEKGVKLLKMISGKPPVKTKTSKRIAAWGIRPGLPIGCKVTIRGPEAAELLKRLLGGVDNKLSLQNFDGFGNISFGVLEYIDIPGMDYDPEIGVIGFQVSVTLERPGYRVMRRRLLKRPVSRHHRISKEEAVSFLKENFNLMLKEEEAEK
ncbi:TPA: 50S ribosomal protein L5 [Candidatus Woesearchaeota archaeon]|nr:50S ribosomal protein L5 [Candidatus Woesearchaeota archaeon]